MTTRQGTSLRMGAVLLPNAPVSPATMGLLAAGQVTAFAVCWSLSATPILPRPLEVVKALRELWLQDGLGRELLTSFVVNVEALFLTTVLSLALSYLTVVPFFRPLAGAVARGRFLGLVGLTFLFTLLLGGGRPLKVALLVFGMSVFFVTSMADVIADIPKEAFDHARTLRMSEWRTVWEVVVLGTADQAFDILRQNAAIGWMMLTMVEGIARSEGGVGAMLLNESKHFRLADVFGIQIVILLMGIFQDYSIGVLKQIICPYAALTLERR